MAMEDWLGDCKARMIDKLEQLWHYNESKFPEAQLQYHKASMERFMGIPLELFAIMCATEVAKYKGNLEGYIEHLEAILNPGGIQLQYPRGWKKEMLEVLQLIIQLVEYVPCPSGETKA